MRALFFFFSFCCLFFQKNLMADWSPPTELSLRLSTQPQIAVDTLGNATAIWRSVDEANYVIQATTKPANGAWPSPLNVSILSLIEEDGFDPQIVIDAFGNATAIWSGDDRENMIIKSSTKPFGGNWTPPSQVASLSLPASSACDPQIAVDPAGNLTAVWQRFNGENTIVQASTKLFGGSWTSPFLVTNLSQPGENGDNSQVVVDAAGNATAIWTITEGTNGIIQASTKPFGGNWEPPINLSLSGEDVFQPQIVVDLAGNATAVWVRTNGNSDRIIQASTKPFGGSWLLPSLVVNLSLPGEDALDPQIGVDSKGNITVVWTSSSNGNMSIIQASEKPFGGNWTLPFNIANLSLPGEEANRPQLTVDSVGNVTAVWERSNGTDSIIQASTKPYGGSWILPFLVTNLSLSGEDAYDPQVASDVAGRVTAVWFRDLIIQSSTSSQVNFLSVTRVFPQQGSILGGETVSIEGTNFVQGTTVTFDGIPVQVNVVNPQLLQVITPPHVEGCVTITLQNILGIVTVPNGFCYEASPPPIIIPTISAIIPSEGIIGTLVTIKGTNFQPDSFVYFGDALAQVTFIDSTTLQAFAPLHALGSVTVTVINPDGASVFLTHGFTYLSPPFPPSPSIVPQPINGKVKKQKNRFATQADLMNSVQWQAPDISLSTPIVAYQVFRNPFLRHPIATIPANKRLRFEDHNRKKGQSYTYYIVSIDAQGRKSEPLILRSRSF